MAPYESRVAFGARTGGEWAHHDLDNVEVVFSDTIVPIVPAFTPGSSKVTHHDLDHKGTPYTESIVSCACACVGPQILAGGPKKNFLRLVSQVPDASSNIAFDLTAPGRHGRIVARFDFRMVPDGDLRADGLSFALLDTSVHCPTGPGPGIGEEPNLFASFGVGFDIFQNEEESSNNHVSLHWNDSHLASVDLDPGELDLADGLFHHATISLGFDADGAAVTVEIDGVTPYSGFFVEGMAPYESRVAFGARTGGEWAHHDLDNIHVRYEHKLPTPPGIPPEGDCNPPADCIEDGDGDGVCDEDDSCAGSDLRPTVTVGDCDTGVPNAVLESGCSINDRIAEIADGVRNRNERMMRIVLLGVELKQARVIGPKEFAAIVQCAARSRHD